VEAQFSIKPGQSGATLAISTPKGKNIQGLAISVAIRRGEERICVTGIGHSEGERYLTFLDTGVSLGEMTLEAARIVEIEDYEKSGKNVGVLAINNKGGRVSVMFSSSARGIRQTEIGGLTSLEEVRNQSKAALKELQRHVTDGSLTTQALHILGSRFSRALLSETGENFFLSELPLLKHLLITSDCPDLFVPWEMVRGRPKQRETLLPFSTHCDIVRCGSNSTSGVKMLRIGKRGLPHRPIGRFCSVGLVPLETCPWRVELPGSFEDFLQAVDGCDTMHIVGRFAQDGSIHVGTDGQLIIDEHTLQAYPPIGAKNIVLSTCKAGTLDPDSSVLSKFLADEDVELWAPPVLIKESQAVVLDNAIGSSADAAGTLNLREAFRSEQVDISTRNLGALYVRLVA
jgi:hypothetical protein